MITLLAQNGRFQRPSKGLGSVDIVLTDLGYGTNRKPTAAQIAQAQEFIDLVRPSGTQVLSPMMSASIDRKIRVTAIPDTDNSYRWDWGLST